MFYRLLNDNLLSHPGTEAPACGETIQKWRQAGLPDNYRLIDISKAYLQVHLSPELQKYQCVVWQEKLYVLERMGFGLSVAPKAMDLIVKWATREIPGIDNYVDDLFVPESLVKEAKEKLLSFGLPTKPEEEAVHARVLGLQMHENEDGSVPWKRREGVCLELPTKPTKRQLFSWCGRLIGHYPVCGWVRPACAFVKRLAGMSDVGWDEAVPKSVVQCCSEIARRMSNEDPVRGMWYVDPASDNWMVWCDASSLATAAVLTQDGKIIEDGAWLREKTDKRHINVAELEAALKGIDLAIRWNVKKVKLATDSKTVAGWLRSVLSNIQRVKVGGLHESLVRLRLQVVADTIAVTGMRVSVEWVSTDVNLADGLTRVPSTWPKVVNIDSIKRDVGFAGHDGDVVATEEPLPDAGLVCVPLDQPDMSHEDEDEIADGGVRYALRNRDALARPVRFQ